MVEHLDDTFDSNATFLKGCIIKDGTSVMLVGIHLMLPKNSMEAKGNFGKKHSPVDAGVQKCAIQRKRRIILVRSIRQSMRAFKSARYSVFFDTAQSP